jgi:hypothetical protein
VSGTRLSDSDRERIVELLARHSAEGRLSTGELERRVAAVYAAESRDDLAPLLADLPPLPAAPANAEPRRWRWGRGHGEATKPGVGWVATDERFRDPTSRRIMRVWIDPASGDRHYVPDDDTPS